MADGGSEEPSPSSESAPSPMGGDTASPSHTARGKVEILLKPAGDAPIMKKRKWALDATKQLAWLIGFIRKYINCQPGESLFIYVNQSFAPAPDVAIGTLYECFGSDGKLVLHYCKSQAWG